VIHDAGGALLNALPQQSYNNFSGEANYTTISAM
jgi:hypothetical protein